MVDSARDVTTSADMPQSNLVSETIAPDDLTAASTAADALIAALDKYFINLTPEERQRLPKISPQDRAVAEDALTVVKNDSSFMAKSFDVDLFEQDVAFFAALYPLWLKLQPFFERWDDTMLATRSDMDNQMRDVYTSGKRNNVTSGMDRLNAYFGQRFRRTPPTTPPGPSATPHA